MASASSQYNTSDPLIYPLLHFLYNDSDSPFNTSVYASERTVVRSILVGIILSIIVVISFVGNLLVVLAIWTNRRLRSVTNYFVASLAMADLLVSLLVMPFHIVVELSGRWWFGFIVCDIWTSLDVLFCTASILNLCCISVDRYFAITRPLVYATRRSKRLALIMIGVVWCASALITCPPIFGWQEADRWKDDSICMLSKDPGYIIYSSMGSFFVPMMIMLFVYAKIFRVTYEREIRLKPYRRSVMMVMRRPDEVNEDIVLSDAGLTVENDESEDPNDDTLISEEDKMTHKQIMVVKHTRQLRHNGVQRTRSSIAGRPPSLLASQYSTLNGNQTARQRRRSEQKRMRAVLAKERKAAKTLSIVVGCFVVCWLPFFLVYIIEPFCQTCHFPILLMIVVTWLGYINSACNPFIYAFSNREFSKSFYNLTIGKIKKCRENLSTDV